MKTKTKIVIGLWVVLFMALMIGVKTAEHNGNDLFEKAGKVSTIVRKNRLRDKIAAGEGDVLIDENKYTVSEEEKQLITEHVAEVKEIFKGHEHLLDSPDDLDLTIDLKMFKDGKEYRFEKLLWNITYEQVQNAMPYSLLEDTARTQLPEDYAYYVSEYKHDLYGQTAIVTFEFYEDQLKSVQLTFSPEGKKKKVEALFESISEAFIDICGQESVKTEDDATGHVGYQWQGENTLLQVDMIESRVIISVGVNER